MDHQKKGNQEETPVKPGYTVELHYKEDYTNFKIDLLSCEIVQRRLLLEAGGGKTSQTHILHLLVYLTRLCCCSISPVS